MYTIFAIFISIFVVIAGQILVKKGLNDLGSIDFTLGIISSYQKTFLSPYVISGILLYISGVLAWLYVLSKLELSYAYPFLALTYVFVTLASLFILHEHVSFVRWIGIITICIGVILISRT